MYYIPYTSITRFIVAKKKIYSDATYWSIKMIINDVFFETL